MVVLQVVLRSVLFGLVGGFATLLLLVCVNFFVWGAFWRPLRNTGWIWLHDVGATYILAFAPMVAAAAFSVLSALVEVIERIRSKPSPLVELVLLVVFPSATALAEMLRLHPCDVAVPRHRDVGRPSGLACSQVAPEACPSKTGDASMKLSSSTRGAGGCMWVRRE